MNTIHLSPMSYRSGIIRFFAAFLILGLACAVPSKQVLAQQLEFDEVQVIAPFEPTISDAFKINFNPVIEDTARVNITFDYSITPRLIPVRFNMEPLSPARMRGEPLAKLYRGYVKAGLGNYTSPYGEVFYNSLRSNEHHYGIHMRHLSSNSGIDEYQYSGYSDNLLHAYGKRFFRNHTLSADVKYERNMVHFYGFRPDDFVDDPFVSARLDTLNNKDFRQRFNFVSPSIGVRSNYLDSMKLQHAFDLSYQYYNDRYDASEQIVSLTGSLRKKLPDDTNAPADRQTLHLDLSAEYFNNNHNADTTHTALFKIAPKISARYMNFDFYVGVNASIQADTASFMRFYPIARAQANLIDNVLYAYASLSGDLVKHTMYDMTRTNPFMQTSSPYAFMNKKSELRGGFKGSLSSFASYNISIGNSDIHNYPFFVNDFTDPLANRFNIIFDDIRLFNFRTEIFSNVGERLKVRFASDYYQYTMDNEDNLYPWHEPTLRITLNLRYNIQDKIILSADGFARNSTFARIPDATMPSGFGSAEIHGLHIDANLGVEYRYTKALSAFLNLNNMQNQPLFRWYNYPSHQFNVLGGVTYSF